MCDGVASSGRYTSNASAALSSSPQATEAAEAAAGGWCVGACRAVSAVQEA